MTFTSPVRVDEQRLAHERRLIDDYVRGAGHDPHQVRARADDAARMLLLSAAAFAASRLRTVDAGSARPASGSAQSGSNGSGGAAGVTTPRRQDP